MESISSDSLSLEEDFNPRCMQQISSENSKDNSIDPTTKLNTPPDEILEYFDKLNIEIPKIFEKSFNEFNLEDLDILDNPTKENIENIKISLKRKQITMKYGDIWQTALGLFPGWENLGQGHDSECDARRLDNSIIVELKNKWNTVNSGGKKDVERKLSNYKNNNPDTECIWGIINPKPSTKKDKEKIVYNPINSEIIKWEGESFRTHIFTYKDIDYSNKVLEILRNIISNYIQ